MVPLTKNLLLGAALGLLSCVLIELGVSSIRAGDGAGWFHYLYYLIPWVVGLCAFFLLRTDYATELWLRALVAILSCLLLIVCLEISQIQQFRFLVSTGGWASFYHLISCLFGIVTGGVIAAYRMYP